MSALPQLRESFVWPQEGVSRVPYRVYTDPDVHEVEQRRLFRGAIWHFLALEQEIPEPGDYRTLEVGETPVVVLRGADGRINAMVNRCAHRGNLVCVARSGRVEGRLTCVYHNWTYDLCGRLESVAFRNGVGGRGGMPDDFEIGGHALERLRVESFCGLVFGTLSPTAAPLAEYLGAEMCENIERVLGREMVALGGYTQLMPNNWKLYMENVRDSYHASLLHVFFTTFRLNRLSMDGGIRLSPRGWHHISYSIASTDREEAQYDAGKLRSVEDGYRMADPRVVGGWPEYPCGTTLAIQSIFPNFIVQQTQNSIALRVCTPKGPEACELSWRILGCASDSAEQRAARIHQSNLIGPGGLISMEDGVVGGWVQRGTRGDRDRSSLLEMGGRGVAPSPGARATEVAVRGFWNGFRELMDV